MKSWIHIISSAENLQMSLVKNASSYPLQLFKTHNAENPSHISEASATNVPKLLITETKPNESYQNTDW